MSASPRHDIDSSDSDLSNLFEYEPNLNIVSSVGPTEPLAYPSKELDSKLTPMITRALEPYINRLSLFSIRSNGRLRSASTKIQVLVVNTFEENNMLELRFDSTDPDYMWFEVFDRVSLSSDLGGYRKPTRPRLTFMDRRIQCTPYVIATFKRIPSSGRPARNAYI